MMRCKLLVSNMSKSAEYVGSLGPVNNRVEHQLAATLNVPNS